MPILSGMEFSSLFNSFQRQRDYSKQTHVDFMHGFTTSTSALQSLFAFGDWSRDTADYRRRCRVFVSK